MRIISQATGKEVRFNEMDNVLCIGSFIGDEAVKRAVKRAGTEILTIIPTVNDYKNGFSDSADMKSDIMKYDYHLLIMGRSPKHNPNIVVLGPGRKAPDSSKYTVNTKNIRFMDLGSAILYKTSQGQIIRATMVILKPSIVDRLIWNIHKKERAKA